DTVSMSHEYRAWIIWSGDGEGFDRGNYSREHLWRFDGGVELTASASPQVVPLPYSSEHAIDPEEAYVASISSCHMLTFLHIASKRRFIVRSYNDAAVGVMERNEEGKLAVTRVTLKPVVEFDGQAPSED